ncbi:MAG: zf-HC2 domain-containing protein, partial [Burkholderiales bacterium]|nr:zf-HC2 domain-containing protein [Phycisphaerae bacterium]
MSSNTEHIEARLAAYIDGELSPDERVEIEKYLVANPAHRKLIDELAAIRSQVGSLPRESAPVEVLDHLQSNLERHALLEDVEAGSLRINRWPQWTAAAAMLFLTLGLGTLVYLVLPRGELNRDQIVLAPQTEQRTPAGPLFSELKDEEPKPADATTSAATAVLTPSNKKFESSDSTIASGVGVGGDNTFGGARRAEATEGIRDGNFGGGGGGGGAGNIAADNDTGSLVLNNGSAIVVQTDDLLLTQNLVAGYLGQNNFQFQPVPGDAITLNANRGVLQLSHVIEPPRQDLAEVVNKLKENQGS